VAAVSSSSVAAPRAAPVSRRNEGDAGSAAGDDITEQRPDHGLRPAHRLRKATDFEAVFGTAQRSSDALFTVLYRPSGLEVPRLGLAIAAKRVRTAVGRNRLRRLIRESFRVHKATLAGLDIVVLARDGAAQAANDQVAVSLAAHWKRLGRGRVQAQQ
jgi:ribonuclease P protein component